MTEVQKNIATIGMFDGVHRGHQALIAAVKEYGKRACLNPIVVTFHPHPVAVIRPGHEPKLLTDYDKRRALLSECLGNDDGIVELAFDEDLRKKTAVEFMQMLHNIYNVRVLVMGYNHSFGADRIKDFEQYKRLGASVGIEVLHGEQMCDEQVALQVSSSTIRNLISEGDIVTANKLLGRRYALHGTVVSGRQVGRTIGFPTANLRVTKGCLVPLAGVYAASVSIDGNEHAAMVNIGTCPTVSDCGKQTIEANVIDWQGDLYDADLSINFIKHLRSEQHFDSLDALMQQLAVDRAATLNAQ